MRPSRPQTESTIVLPGSLEIDVHAAGFRPDGTHIGGASGLVVTAAPDAQFVRGLAYSREKGVFLAVWEDRTKGWSDMDVWGAVVPSGFWRGYLLDTR
jgi:hypothetical protein